MRYNTSYQSRFPKPPKSKRSKRTLFLLVVVILLAAALWWLFMKGEDVPAPQSNQSATQPTPAAEPAPPSLPDLSGLQTLVEDWAAAHGGNYSVTILDEAGETVAAYKEDTEYFSASIYKLFVAYEGYKIIEDQPETYSLTEPYMTGYTRGKCLDAMIRSSYSPCAEKMWVELGKETINDNIKDYGITNTNMVGLRTTAQDSAKLLYRLYKRQDLTDEHVKLYLDSMKTQEAIYRRGLPTGFTDAVVYNKVGWNEDIEWHDTAIVEFKNGRVLVVSVLTKNAGSKNIAGLGTAIEEFVEAAD